MLFRRSGPAAIQDRRTSTISPSVDLFYDQSEEKKDYFRALSADCGAPAAAVAGVAK
jgi:hypothetical protein